MSLSCGLKLTSAESTLFKSVKKSCGKKTKSPQCIEATEERKDVLETALEQME